MKACHGNVTALLLSLACVNSPDSDSRVLMCKDKIFIFCV